jgi:hypothetical protein
MFFACHLFCSFSLKVAQPFGRTPEFLCFRKKDQLFSGTTSGQAMFPIYLPDTQPVRFYLAKSGLVTSGSVTTLNGTRGSAGSITMTDFQKSRNRNTRNKNKSNKFKKYKERLRLCSESRLM